MGHERRSTMRETKKKGQSKGNYEDGTKGVNYPKYGAVAGNRVIILRLQSAKMLDFNTINSSY